MADLDTVALVTAALAGKRFRASLGGEWHVASYIVSRMVHAPKCRAADDLLMSAELQVGSWSSDLRELKTSLYSYVYSIAQSLGISVAIIAVVNGLGTKLNTTFSNITNAIN